MKCDERKTNTKENTPYDDVGKTMLHGCPKFMIPVVNEIFGEDYSLTDPVELLSEGHYLQESTERINKGFKDSYFRIIGEKTGRYHIEVQSYEDDTIVLRMFEYDIGAALSESMMESGKLIITIVKSAVIYLRHGPNTPNVLIVEIRTPGGNVSYEIPVLKTQRYSLDEILEKKLWYLLPFYLFCYQNEFKKIEKDEEKLQKLKDEYKKIRETLNLLHENGQITLYEKQTLISMIKKITRNLAANYKRIREGVEECMGGKVLMHEAEALTQSGIRKGIALEKKNTERERKNAEFERKRADEANLRANKAAIEVNEAKLEIFRLKELLIKNGISYA